MEEIQTKEKVEKTPKKHLFKKGQPGGPGRPKGSVSLITAIKQRLSLLSEDKRRVVLEVLADQIVQDALSKGTSDANRRLILNYLEGMPRQSVNYTGEINLPFRIIIQPPPSAENKQLPNGNSDTGTKS